MKLQNCANRQLYTVTYITVKTQMITINSIAIYIYIYIIELLHSYDSFFSY